MRLVYSRLIIDCSSLVGFTQEREEGKTSRRFDGEFQLLHLLVRNPIYELVNTQTKE